MPGGRYRAGRVKRSAAAASITAAVAFGLLCRSTMMASPKGMMLAASMNQPSRWGTPLASRIKAMTPDAMSRTPLTER